MWRDRLLIPILLATALAACRPTPAGEPAQGLPYDRETYGDLESVSPRSQVVVHWYHQTGEQEELLLELIDEFNSSNEWDITVIGEYAGPANAAYDAIRARIGGSALPSMAVAEPYQVATYAAQAALVALDPYVDHVHWGYTRRELGDFFPAALATGDLPQFGARYGWPLYESMDVMYYNEDWLAELGYQGPPETWEQFAEMACKAVEQPFSGTTGDGPVLGHEYVIDASRFATFVLGHGGSVINQDGTAYTFNSPQGLEALSFLKGLVDRGCAGPATGAHGDQADFAAGRVLFTISSAFRLRDYEEAVEEGAGFQWNVNPPPHTTPEPRMNIRSDSLVVFRTTPEQQLAAWLFVEWMSEPEQQARWASATGYYPSRRSVTDRLADTLVENPIEARALAYVSYEWGIEVAVAGYDECRPAIGEMLEAVLGGEDAGGQLDATAARCNEHLRKSTP